MTLMTSGGRQLRIDGVGGGIGGVTLAAALHHGGLPFRLFRMIPRRAPARQLARILTFPGVSN